VNIRDRKVSNQGFTIVELLIVVVVIAILAAITIVSYNGITSRANASSAKSTAASLQKKIELYNTEVGNYPVNLTDLSGDSSKSYYVSSSAYGNSAPTATSSASTYGTTYVQLRACRSSTATLSTSNVNGTQIIYYNFDGAATATFAYLGASATACANATNLL
jgi:prepilin-type N-terminal cleavage/methylation domain-containing protein